MKFLIILVSLLCLNLSDISCTKLRSSIRNNLLKDPKTDLNQSDVYQFNLGFITALSAEQSLLDQCYKEVQDISKSNDEQAKYYKSEQGKGTKALEVWKKIDALLVKDLDAICNFREFIIDYLQGKAKKSAPAKFFQGKSSKRRTRFDVKGMWAVIQPNVGDVGKAVVGGSKKIGKTVIKSGDFLNKKEEDVYKFVEEKIKSVLQPLLTLIDDSKAELLLFLSDGPIVKIFTKFVECYFLHNESKKFKIFSEAIKNFVDILPKIDKPEGWISLVIDMVCGWESLKKGIASFTKYASEQDHAKKSLALGEGFGFIMQGVID